MPSAQYVRETAERMSTKPYSDAVGEILVAAERRNDAIFKAFRQRLTIVGRSPHEDRAAVTLSMAYIKATNVPKAPSWIVYGPHASPGAGEDD